jgi:hypothetical protein
VDELIKLVREEVEARVMVERAEARVRETERAVREGRMVIPRDAVLGIRCGPWVSWEDTYIRASDLDRCADAEAAGGAGGERARMMRERLQQVVDRANEKMREIAMEEVKQQAEAERAKLRETTARVEAARLEVMGLIRAGK